MAPQEAIVGDRGPHGLRTLSSSRTQRAVRFGRFFTEGRDARSQRPAFSRAARQHPIVLALSASASLLFFALSYLRFASFHNTTFDLAFYARMAWGEAHLDGWNPIVNAHARGLHLSFVLIPLGLLGAIFGQVRTLLVAQSIAVALTTWPIARFGARMLGPRGAWIGAASFLLYPNISQVASNDFHPGTLAVLPLSSMLEGLDRRDLKVFAYSVLGVLACREDLGLITALAGLLLMHRGRAHGDSRSARLGAQVALASLLYVLFFALVLLPILAPRVGSLQLHFGRWGSSLPAVLGHLLVHPGELFAHLGSHHRYLYFAVVLGPVAGLSLLRPRFLLLGLPVLAINLLSHFPGTTDLGSHYLTPAVPAVLFSAIEGAAALPRKFGLSHWPLLVVSLASHALYGGTPFSLAFRSEDYSFDRRSIALRSIVERIGPTSSVQAPDTLLPHLAERLVVKRPPPPEARTRFVVLDLSHRRRFAHNEDLLRTDEEPLARDWLARPDHALVIAGADHVLLERERDPRSGIGVSRYIVGTADPETGTRLTECLSLLGTRVAARTPSFVEVVLDLVARAPCESDLALRIGVGDRPAPVDLIAEGLLSPAHFKRGDHIVSPHRVPATEAVSGLLRIGALRSSGARPEHRDPMSIPVELIEHTAPNQGQSRDVADVP